MVVGEFRSSTYGNEAGETRTRTFLQATADGPGGLILVGVAAVTRAARDAADSTTGSRGHPSPPNLRRTDIDTALGGYRPVADLDLMEALAVASNLGDDFLCRSAHVCPHSASHSGTQRGRASSTSDHSRAIDVHGYVVPRMSCPAHGHKIRASINAGPPAVSHLEVDAMYTHQIATARRPPLDAHIARPSGDYDAETLDALRSLLADLAWSDQGE